MSTGAIVGIAIGIFVLILIFWFFGAWNRLVRLENNRENAFADIDVQLKQRYDLIPQLMGAVKGYMDHESEVLTRVTAARSRCLNAGNINEKIEANQELGSALGAFNIQIEAYPDLKANQNFMHLQHEIADIAILLLGLCQCADIDLSSAIQEKIALNAKKYPVEGD